MYATRTTKHAANTKILFSCFYYFVISSNFPKIFSQMATSQKCNFPSGKFQVYPSRSAWSLVSSSRSDQPQAHPSCSARPPLQPTSPQKVWPNLLEVAAWEIAYLGSCHLVNCHLRSRPWELPLGKYLTPQL